jgi:heat shock protein HtpX
VARDRLYLRIVAEHEALRGRPLTRPGWSTGRAVATGVALLVHALVLSALGAGAWLCTRGFPSLVLIPGLVLVAVAVGCWPRFAPLPRHATVLPPGAAPALRELVGRVAAAVGVPEPRFICLADAFSAGFSADGGRYGVLHRRYLSIGVPLWTALGPQQRVALLAHQLAHFTDGNPRRGRLIGPADTVLVRLASVFTPGRDVTIRALQDPAIVAAVAGGAVRQVSSTQGMVWIGELLVKPVFAAIRGTVTLVRLALVAPSRRDTWRAEYFSDALAAEVAGSVAVTELLDLMLCAEPVVMMLRQQARTRAPVSTWPAVAAAVRYEGAPRLRTRRESSVREGASPYAMHPPLGLRADLVESRPEQVPTLVLDGPENARIDTELDRYAQQANRDLKVVG